MADLNGEQKELRSQRHGFVIEYYKMAVLDLDRHLKGGWQTIVLLAGALAVLTVGHDGKLPIPVAVSLALIISYWGMLNVLDADYWALRAIAFLANVEAVYFSVEDRKYLNPYVGIHPPHTLLNSLQYQFVLCLLFAVACVADLSWEIWRLYPGVPQIWHKVLSLDWFNAILWAMPWFVAIWGTNWTIATKCHRLNDYLSFVKASPGPGVRLRVSDWRHVDLSPIANSGVVELENDTQAAMRSRLERECGRCRALLCWFSAFAGLVTVSFMFILLGRL